jgi:hypothetical protein
MELDLSRVRRPSRRFGWVDRRVLTEGRLTVLGPVPVALYLVLCVVADRHGVSWYAPGTLAGWVKCSPDRIRPALQCLVETGLLALAGRYVQILDLDLVISAPFPSQRLPTVRPELIQDEVPVVTARQQLDRLPTNIRENLLSQARTRLVRITGRREPSQSVVEAVAASLMNPGVG